MTSSEFIWNQKLKKDPVFVLCNLKSMQRNFIKLLGDVLFKFYVFYQNC